jgi:hypothetical protein
MQFEYKKLNDAAKQFFDAKGDIYVPSIKEKIKLVDVAEVDKQLCALVTDSKFDSFWIKEARNLLQVEDHYNYHTPFNFFCAAITYYLACEQLDTDKGKYNSTNILLFERAAAYGCFEAAQIVNTYNIENLPVENSTEFSLRIKKIKDDAEKCAKLHGFLGYCMLAITCWNIAGAYRASQFAKEIQMQEGLLHYQWALEYQLIAESLEDFVFNTVDIYYKSMLQEKWKNFTAMRSQLIDNASQWLKGLDI